jgi:hypothetical protein
MSPQLKQAIFNYMCENATEIKLVSNTRKKFREYIYNPEGEYRFGGLEVAGFIYKAENLIKD